MSRRASYSYSIDYAARAAARALRQAEYEQRRAEQQRRQAEWAQRTAEVTSGHLARYQAILDDISEQGLAEFVTAEFEEISQLVARARSVTDSDPAAARDLSRKIGPRLGPLPRTARQFRAARRAAGGPALTPAASDRSRETPSRETIAPAADKPATRPAAPPTESAVDAAWRESLAEWTDFLARDLAFADLAALRQQISTSSGISDATAIKAEVDGLKAKWGSEAEKQRRVEAELADLQQQFDEEPAAVAEIVPPEGEIPTDEPAADPEEARREAVRAVMGTLEDAGFQVANPRIVNGEVVVVGTRPSGASATFNLTLDGALEYDFSGYRGSSCDVDIDAVVPALQEVYGIRLTDEVVAWRNPDDEDAAARPQPGRTRDA